MHSNNNNNKKKRSLGFPEIETKFCGNSLAYSEFPVYQNRPGAILTELQVLPPPPPPPPRQLIPAKATGCSFMLLNAP